MLVQRGFADIPVGEMSHFIISRTAVQRCSTRPAAQKTAAQQSSVLAERPYKSPNRQQRAECQKLSRCLRRSRAMLLYYLHSQTVHRKTAVKAQRLLQSRKQAGALAASKRNRSLPLQNKTTTAKFSDYWDVMRISFF